MHANGNLHFSVALFGERIQGRLSISDRLCSN